jgi:cytochrome P450
VKDFLSYYRYLGGALLEGGSETTALFLQSLVQALVVFPEAQRKAQEEIDRVIGSERVPTLDDIKDLPYVQAVVKEVILAKFCFHGKLTRLLHRF